MKSTKGRFTERSGVNIIAGGRVIGRRQGSTKSFYLTDHLGSTRAVFTSAGVVQEVYDYYPFGLVMPGRTLVSGTGTKEQFTGKEREEETGLHYFGARYYMPAVGRWGSVDPLADEYPGWSPYTYVMGDPLNNFDPDGRSVSSPVYDRDGNLLGTDDEGLRGKAIVMKAENFKQGMSHQEALSHSLGAEGLNGEAARERLIENYHSLPSRPDYDGSLTFMEAVNWYNKGGGQPLYVDGRSLNLKPISVEDVQNAPEGYIDSFGVTERNTGAVYGTIKITLIDESTGAVRLGGAGNYLDLYDFEPGSRAGRIADLLKRGKPIKYRIFCSVCTNYVSTGR